MNPGAIVVTLPPVDAAPFVLSYQGVKKATGPSPVVVMTVGFLAAFTIGLIIPILYTYTGENFPTNFRATAIALSDGFGHLGGALAGMALTGLVAAHRKRCQAAHRKRCQEPFPPCSGCRES